MKIVFATVIYYDALKYLDSFLQSLEAQTFKLFDLLLVNDDINPKLINGLIKKYNLKTKIINTKKSLSIVELRKVIIDYSIENNYHLLILGDCDDYFLNNRVKSIIQQFDIDKDFFYNKITPISNNGKIISSYGRELPAQINDYKEILNYNFLGLSNTSLNLIKTRKYLKEMKISNVIAFDWYLYSLLLYNHYYGKLVDNTETFYRIHENNTAGITNLLTEETLIKGIRVKENHYKALLHTDDTFKHKLANILKLKKSLDDNKYRKLYIDTINKNSSTSLFWWENIKTLEEMEELKWQ